MAHADHEDDGQRQPVQDQGDDHDDGENQVEPEQVRSPNGLVLFAQRDLQVDALQGLAFCQPQPLALISADEVGAEPGPEHPDDHGGQDRREKLGGVHVKRRKGPCRGTAPGDHVHDPGPEADDPREGQRAHVQAAEDRDHGRAGDHEGGGAVAVESNQHRQHDRPPGRPSPGPPLAV